MTVETGTIHNCRYKQSREEAELLIPAERYSALRTNMLQDQLSLVNLKFRISKSILFNLNNVSLSFFFNILRLNSMK